MKKDTSSEIERDLALEENTELTEAEEFSEEENYTVPSAEKLLEDDLSELREEFPELSDISEITELQNPTRYAALRDLGLTPSEAYLATSPKKRTDNRSHLLSGVPHAAKSPVSSMTKREWNIARALFEDMADTEIEKLYKKVTQ